MGVSAEGYTAQLQALMPLGRAWPRDADSALRALLEGLAQEFARLDARAEELLRELDPRGSVELLPDWERLLGLPDECSGIAATLADRRRDAHAKLTGVAGLDKASIIAAAAALGYTITIDELDQVRADAIPGLDTTGGKWRFVWWVNVPGVVRYWTVLSGVNEPLATYGATAALSCRIRAISPAHTLPQFAFT